MMRKTFGRFEFDDQRRTLTADGQPVRLSGQALDFFALLFERPGDLISREEIQRRLWPDTNVDFDHSVDVLASRLRTVLGEPRYIETVPRRGYRFTEPVSAKTNHHRARRFGMYAAVVILTAILAILFVRTRYDKFAPSNRARPSALAPAR